jgi:hypothetical protein
VPVCHGPACQCHGAASRKEEAALQGRGHAGNQEEKAGAGAKAKAAHARLHHHRPLWTSSPHGSLSTIPTPRSKTWTTRASTSTRQRHRPLVHESRGRPDRARHVERPAPRPLLPRGRLPDSGRDCRGGVPGRPAPLAVRLPLVPAANRLPGVGSAAARARARGRARLVPGVGRRGAPAARFGRGLGGRRASRRAAPPSPPRTASSPRTLSTPTARASRSRSRTRQPRSGSTSTPRWRGRAGPGRSTSRSTSSSRARLARRARARET